MKQRDFVTIADLSKEKIQYLIDLSQEFERHPNRELLKGKVIASLPLFKAESLYTEVPVYEHKKTFYASYKDWFPLMMFLILIFNIFLEKKRFKLSPMINKEG